MLTDYTILDPARTAAVVDEAIAAADLLVVAVESLEDPRTYANTMAPIDDAETLVDDAYGVGGFMAQVHPDEAVRRAASLAEEKVDKWHAGLAFRRGLFEAITSYSQTEDAAALDGERRRNLDFWLRDLRRAGHELGADDRDEVERLRNRLIEIEVAFERNLSEWDDGIEVTREQLAGLPDAFVDRLAPGSAAGTYRVTVDNPDYVPFMNEARDRDLRRELQYRYLNRAGEANTALLNEAVELRWKMARRLGYATFAEYAMEPKMADPRAVADFYASILGGLTELGRKELAALQELMELDHPDTRLEAWDWAYYDTVQRRLEFGVDDNLVSEYFALDAVVAGMFDVCSDVFGLDFARVDEPRAWHPDVEVYAISDRATGELLAHYYADLFPRTGKYSHAACWRLQAGIARDGGYRRPVSAVAANFTKPTADAPSLLKHDEAVTLWHEFGHVLHNALTRAALPRFSGTQTESDFVEAPSQIMENWMWEPEVLNRFARHYRTGAPIPGDLVDSMVAARDQNVALKTLRQVFYGHYDLALHGGAAPGDAEAAYHEHVGITLVPGHPGTKFGAGFGHMANGGYVAGYYGYLWSLVYGSDMFSIFEDEGILSPVVGARYRDSILAAGGTKDGTDLLRDFLGREPSPAAFLRRIGLSG